MNIRAWKKYLHMFMAFAVFMASFCLAVPVMAEEEEEYEPLGYITDAADILTTDEYDDLLEIAEEIAENHGFPVYVITVDNYEEYGSSVEEAASNIYNECELGDETDEDGHREGLLMLLSMDNRKYDLNAHGRYGEYVFDYDAKGELEDAFLPDFRNNNWYEGMKDYLRAADQILTEYENGERTGSSGDGYEESFQDDEEDDLFALIPMFLIGGGLGAVLTVWGLMGQLKTVESASTAQNYIVDTIKLRKKQDFYVTTTRRVVKKEKKKSSGGGHSSSGGSHRSGSF